MEGRRLRLVDCISFARLQQLQDNLASATNLSCIVLGPDGKPLTRPSRPAAFCRMVDTALGEEHTCHNYVAPSPELLAGNITSTCCTYSGLRNIFIPFLCEGQYLGCWALHQTHIEAQPLSAALLADTAGQLGLSGNMLEDAAGMLPQYTQKELNNIVSMLAGLARMLCKDAGAEGAPALFPSRVEHTVALLAKFMNIPEAGMVASDYETGEILLANGQFCSFVGKAKDEILGYHMQDFRRHDFDSYYASCTVERMLDEYGNPAEPVQWNDYSTHHGAWIRCTNQLVYWPDGRLAHLSTFQDISNERRTQDELSRLAYYDRQMNLPNSLKLSHDLARVWNHVKASEEFLVCFDITSLRRLNDAHGRRAGDIFLETVIKWLAYQQLPEHTVYRIEGDEFCIRMSGVDIAAATATAQCIFNRFSDLWSLSINGQPVSILTGVSISVIGLHTLRDDDELLSVIQRTLDISRRENKIVVYDEETDRELKAHTQVQLALKKCIKQHMRGFDVHYQPIVEPATGLWKGLEALCRWSSPEVGVISPMVFIREAEQLGLINQIGEWVLETSVKQCKAWGLDELDGFFLSVNLSPVQIMSPSLINSTLEILKRHEFPGHCLSLEVTESTRLNFNNHTLGVIENLCSHGIRIALDDFGTGYSSFNNMKNLPVTFVKTDHTFIRGIEEDSYMQYFYHIITELAHKTGLKLVVEGVETQEQLDIMMKNGVDYIQGYYFGKPMPAEKLEGHLFQFTRAAPPAIRQYEPQEGLVDGREGYLITKGTFNVQTKCMQVLLNAGDIDKAISEVLRRVGEHFKVSRAYMFRRLRPGVYSNTHEWCAPGVQPQKPGLTEAHIAEVSPSWLPMLQKHGLIVATDITHLPQDIMEPMQQQDIRALAIVGLLQDGEVNGFLGFDDCEGHRYWQPEEVSMLQNLALIIENRLEKAPPPAHSLGEGALAQVMEHMVLPAFISDLETGEVLWANNSMLAKCGRDAVGQKCYKLLPGCDNRCEDCRAKGLPGIPGGCFSQLVADTDGKHSIGVYHCLVPYSGGRHTQLEYWVDLRDFGAEAEAEARLEELRWALGEDRVERPRQPEH